jgi:hypothetical protein
MLPRMDPTEALAASPRQPSAETTAPAAAAWLDNPAALVKRVSLAMQLAAEPPWVAPKNEDTR